MAETKSISEDLSDVKSRLKSLEKITAWNTHEQLGTGVVFRYSGGGFRSGFSQKVSYIPMADATDYAEGKRISIYVEGSYGSIAEAESLTKAEVEKLIKFLQSIKWTL